MAMFDCEIPPDLIRKLERLSNIEAWAGKVLTAGAKVYADEIKKNLAQHRDTGDLIAAISPQKVVYNPKSYVHSVSVYDPKAPTHGARNALKLAELEYGNSNQDATPVIESARKAAEAAMRQIILDELAKEMN